MMRTIPAATINSPIPMRIQVAREEKTDGQPLYGHATLGKLGANSNSAKRLRTNQSTPVITSDSPTIRLFENSVESPSSA